MLWLIVGVILLIIAIAGGVIIHPILFALGIVAIVMFLMRGSYAERRPRPARGPRDGAP